MTADDFEDLQDWHPCDRTCPDCGSAVEEGAWWDDVPENGGACIGTLWRCTREGCDWVDDA